MRLLSLGTEGKCSQTFVIELFATIFLNVYFFLRESEKRRGRERGGGGGSKAGSVLTAGSPTRDSDSGTGRS